MLLRWCRLTGNLIRASSQTAMSDNVTAPSTTTINRIVSVNALVVCCIASGVTGTAKTSLCRFEAISNAGLMSIVSMGAYALQQYCSFAPYAAEVLFEQEVVKSLESESRVDARLDEPIRQDLPQVSGAVAKNGAL